MKFDSASIYKKTDAIGIRSKTILPRFALTNHAMAFKSHLIFVAISINKEDKEHNTGGT
jgi:hypothetical protein